jgi:hypothetical protein
MESSILTSTKKILGISEDYTAFDPDILTHINSALSTLNQLGVGPINGVFIDDAIAVWSDLQLPANQLNLVRTYVYLKTRMLFDPPATSFLIEAIERQIAEHEWRLSVFREGVEHPLSLLEETENDCSI